MEVNYKFFGTERTKRAYFDFRSRNISIGVGLRDMKNQTWDGSWVTLSIFR